MAQSIFLIALQCMLMACSGGEGQLQNSKVYDTMIHETSPLVGNMQTDTITLGAGCFWCVEAQLQLLEGVVSVKSGYAGGSVKNPSYREVCTGATGHAEVVQVVYKPEVLSTDALLAAFWQSHDPTQLNRQGNDVGTQYRSVIFYHTDAQRVLAEAYIKKLNDEKVYDKPVVTQVQAMPVFYEAEDYHQNYYRLNSEQGYCQYVIQPKLEKFKKVFKDKLVH
jgi:peptide-methionine (S)-S-oxide reductase